jgi:hypothetical protein
MTERIVPNKSSARSAYEQILSFGGCDTLFGRSHESSEPAKQFHDGRDTENRYDKS